jgi:AcrR family transcriptional regulator
MEQAISLFRAKGYSATSIDEIVKACGITKGSLYYHFRSKEELALAAMEQVHAYFSAHVFGLIVGADHPGASELDAFNQAVEAFFVTHPDGCLLANLSLEIGAAHGLFGERIRSFFNDWRNCYAKVFREICSPARADTLAEDAVAFVHGCILMYRIDGNIDLLRRQHRRLLALLDHPSPFVAAAETTS